MTIGFLCSGYAICVERRAAGLMIGGPAKDLLPSSRRGN